MTSEVSICSNALLMLGARPIQSFDDPPVVNGIDRSLLCRNLWPTARDAVLRMHPWNCATKRVVLSPEVDTPPFEYTNQFALPGDWLRNLSINEVPADKYDFRIEGRKLLCDDDTIYLRYIYRNTDYSSWDALLIECAELYMAHKLAMPVTQQISVRDSYMQEVQMKLRAARSVDGQEDPPETMGNFALLEARYAGSPRRGD